MTNFTIQTVGKPMKNIEWATKTWNPVTGCKNACTWTAPDGKVVGCYARAISERFHMQADFSRPVFHADRLIQPYQWKKPQRIFVCSMGDLFADCVPDEWIEQVLNTIASHMNQHHTFLLLTKNPKRLAEFNYPPNCWVGATVDYRRRLMPTLEALCKVQASVRFISHEPLVETMANERPDGGKSMVLYHNYNINWAIIGALSAGAKKYQPKAEWVCDISLACAVNIPVFMKDNLDCEALGLERRRELP